MSRVGNLFNWYLGGLIMLFWGWVGNILSFFGQWKIGHHFVMSAFGEWRMDEVSDVFLNPLKLGKGITMAEAAM